jgi:Zn finger protein HypA/HybF involved in hydrogenase expression
MHELALWQSLLGEAEAVAGSRSTSPVTDVYANVGPLRVILGNELLLHKMQMRTDDREIRHV